MTVRRGGILLALAIWLQAVTAGAADILVDPIRIRLTTPEQREAITVTNRGTDPLVVDVESVSWTQSNGDDRYAPTDELIVNPPVFTVPPGKTQIVRVGLRRPRALETEAPYRIFLREVPTAAVGGRSGLRVLMRIGLPIFVAPRHSDRRVEWQARIGPDGHLALTAVNSGNVHLQVSEFRIQDSGDKPQVLQSRHTNDYLLPGQTRRWDLGAAKPWPPGAHVGVTTDRGEQDVPIAGSKP